MKLFFKKIIITLLVFLSSVWFVLSWNGLIAENWDLLNLTKWNELINELQSKVWFSDIIEWTNINLTYSWSQIVINSAGGTTIPFITNENNINVWTNQTETIIIDWINFTPNSTINIPWFDGTINSITVLSPNQLEANVTTWATEFTYDLIVSNNWTLNTLWSWNGASLFNVWPVIANWPAWTYTEDFESNTLWNWNTVDWLPNQASTYWQTEVSWTANSNTTWPLNAAWGNYYIYTEVSNPDNPNFTFAIETSYFRHAQTISFDYHMYWATMWDVIVQTLANWVRTDIYTISGQQQTAETDAWINTWNINLVPYQVEAIRIYYTWGTWYQWDASLDNIVITSI